VPLPIDLRLALAPLDTYRELTAERADGSWLRALERPALVAVIVGTSITLSAAGRVPLGLVLMGILCWSFVPALQLLLGAMVSGIARTRSISMARSLELLFIAQLPWSLWVLAMTGLFRFSPVRPGLVVQVLSLLVPGVWTAVIVSAFCQAALGCTKRRARLLTAVHQAMMWTIFFTYVLLVSGFWARILALVDR
jgi:hypothetical protein